MTNRWRLALIALLVSITCMSVITPAQASSFRYWSFWHANAAEQWTFANEGAGTYRPADGSVQGWRFSISQGATSSNTPPRATARFSSICQGVPAQVGKNRVGFVIDYGTTADAPTGEQPPAIDQFCLVTAPGSRALSLFNAANATYRASSIGFICGINGYPKNECGVNISPTQAEPAQKVNPAVNPTTSSAQPQSRRPTAAPTIGPAGSQTKKDQSAPKPAPQPRSTPVSVARSAPSTTSPVKTVAVLLVVFAIGGSAVLIRRRNA